MEETIQNPQLPSPNLSPQPVEESKSSLDTIGAKAGLAGGLGAGLVRSFNKRKTIGKGAITTLGSGALMSGLGYIAGNIGDSVMGKTANLGGDQNMTDLYTAAMMAKQASVFTNDSDAGGKAYGNYVGGTDKQASEDGDVSVAGMAAKGTALGAGAGLFGAVAGNAANDANVARRIVNGTNAIFPGAIDTSTKLKLMGQGALNGVKRLGFKGAMGSAAVGAGLGLGSYTGKALYQNYQNSKTANYGEIKGDDNMSDLLQAAYMAKLAANPVPVGTYRGGQGPVLPARGPLGQGQGPVLPKDMGGRGPVTPAPTSRDRYVDNAPGGQGPVNPQGPNIAERAYASAKRQGSYAYDAAADMGETAKTKGTSALEYAKGKGNSALAYAKANPKRVGGGVLGAAAAAGAGIYAYNHMQEKAASYIDEPSYEEVLMAKMAAEEMYDECMEKMAFAEQLFEEADFLQGGYEKLAADNGSGEPVTWVDQLRTPVGATMTGAAAAAGMVGGALLARGRGATAMGMGGAAVAGGLLGAGTAAAGLGAVHAFTEQHRQARAAQYQATPGM